MALSLLVILLPGALAEDRLYFTGMVEANQTTGMNQVLLIWGPLEQAIPDDLTAFRIYRRPVLGSFALLAEVPRGLVDVGKMQSFFEEPGEELRQDDIQKWAEDSSGGSVMGTDVYPYLHGILSATPGSDDYNPIRNVFLARMSIDVARSLGEAYIDRDFIALGNFEYMITGMIGTAETLPLGKTIVSPTLVDVLPAPNDFTQVYVGGCSLIGRGIDDRRIHFRWDIPEEPEKLRLRILTYGYDLFRADSDLSLGPDDIRNMQLAGSFNPALTKVNDLPIIVAGQAPTEGRESFLAIDEGDPSAFAFLERGRTYVYYLVAKDLTGKYSKSTAALEAMVPDSMAPPAPWGVRSEEIKDPSDPSIPRIQLVWDEINTANYLRQYGRKKTFLSPPAYASPSELYYVPEGEPPFARNYRETDLDFTRYLVFRFDTQEGAQSWGADSDLDYWPDEIEDASGTDKCDEISHPAGNPPQLAAIINQSDSASLRTLANGIQQRFFIDSSPAPDNHVYWYRLIAIDQFENQSPLSPPVRGVLWDRTQPEPQTSVTVERCVYAVKQIERCQLESGISFGFYDSTKSQKAARVCLYEVCYEKDQAGSVGTGVHYIPITCRDMKDGRAFLALKELQRYCESLCGNGGESGRYFVVRYYDASGRLLATSSVFTTYLCRGDPLCFELVEICRERPGNPGETLDPDEPINVCVTLEPGERARLFHELNGKMTAFDQILAPLTAVGSQVYCITEDLTAIVPAGACIGVRVFSQNNVGSYLKYLNCLTLPSSDPEAPLMNSVDPTGTAPAPTFVVRWAAQSEGLSAFVLSQEKNGSIKYETYWINSSNLKYNNGLYEVEVSLDPATDLNQEFCYRVRSVDKALKGSPWSETLCGTWEKEPGDHLTWPPVPETAAGSGILAYFLNVQYYPQPVLVLSDDLTDTLHISERCNVEIPSCRDQKETPCLQTIPFNCVGICDQLRAANKYGKFIVYRQQENRDFVQVSPLIDTFWCYRQTSKTDNGVLYSSEHLDDPFIFLAEPLINFIFPISIRPEVSGLRLIFADNYPCKTGTKVRYQVMVVDPSTGEGTAMHYSNWLEIP